ncbi:MAG: phage tail protein [Plesiomonas sp.]
MAAKYFAILTNLGAAKLANATALGTQLEITHMAVGDGGGSLPIPDPAQTALKGERRRAAINLLTVDPLNQNQIITEQVIPETVGGWWIREAGLFDKDGTLVAIANCPETYKPQLQEGSGRTQVVRVILIVSNAESVSLKIDPSVVLATRKYVDDNIIEVKTYADNLLAAHINGDPHTQYAPKASPTFTGTPVAPTPVKADNTTKLATTAFVKTVAADYAPVNSPALTGKPTTPTPAASANDTSIANAAFVKLAITNLRLGNSATKNVGTAAGSVAAGDDARIVGAMQKAQNGADIPDKNKFLQNLQIKSAAKCEIGTSGNTVPLLSGENTWSKPQTVPQLFATYRAIISRAGERLSPYLTFSCEEFVDGETSRELGRICFGYGKPVGPVWGIEKVTSFINSGVNESGKPYVNIDVGNDGEVGLSTPLKISHGGTGARTVEQALENLQISDGLIPVGIPLPWPLATPPVGWVKCNGAAFDKIKYPKLATAYPSGSLPDLRGVFIRGWDDGRGVDSGRILLSAQRAMSFDHKHWIPTQSGTGTDGPMTAIFLDNNSSMVFHPSGTNSYNQNPSNSTILQTYTAKTTQESENFGSDNMPANTSFNYILRAA